jgi:hypothetical protein
LQQKHLKFNATSRQLVYCRKDVKDAPHQGNNVPPSAAYNSVYLDIGHVRFTYCNYECDLRDPPMQHEISNLNSSSPHGPDMPYVHAPAQQNPSVRPTNHIQPSPLKNYHQFNYSRCLSLDYVDSCTNQIRCRSCYNYDYIARNCFNKQRQMIFTWKPTRYCANRSHVPPDNHRISSPPNSHSISHVSDTPISGGASSSPP